MDEVIADIYEVTAGVLLIIAGVFLWHGGGVGSRIWGSLIILLGVVVLILDILGVI
jgi:hypothetical protein